METKYFRKGEQTRSYTCDSGRILATIEIGGRWYSNPPIQLLLDDGWEEYTPSPEPPYVPTFEEKVVSLIRERYNENSELKFARWARHIDELSDEDKAELDAFDEYVEWCHEKAKEE